MEKRKYYTVAYRDREYEFVIRYACSAPDGYRAYIEDMPDYGTRSDAPSATYRIASGSGHRIGWSGKINTEDEMDRVVELWCQATAMYIADGGSSIARYVEAIRNQADGSADGKKTYQVTYGGRTYDFVFQYRRDPEDGHRAYILSMPDYGDRDRALTATHRMRQGNRYFVCWSQRIDTERELDAVVSLWARATVMYIELGGSSIDRYAERLMRE